MDWVDWNFFDFFQVDIPRAPALGLLLDSVRWSIFPALRFSFLSLLPFLVAQLENANDYYVNIICIKTFCIPLQTDVGDVFAIYSSANV